MGVPAPAPVPEFLVKVIAQRYQLDLVAAPPPRQRADDRRHGWQPDLPPAWPIPDFIDQHKAGKLRVVAVLAARQAAFARGADLRRARPGRASRTCPLRRLRAGRHPLRHARRIQRRAAARDRARCRRCERLPAWAPRSHHLSGEQLAARERATAPPGRRSSGQRLPAAVSSDPATAAALARACHSSTRGYSRGIKMRS